MIEVAESNKAFSTPSEMVSVSSHGVAGYLVANHRNSRILPLKPCHLILKKMFPVTREQIS